MTSCKDCVHTALCKEYHRMFWGSQSLVDSNIDDTEPENCRYFKDCSRFVELPAKSEGLVLSFPWEKIDREVIEMLGLTDFVRDHTDRGKAVRYDQKKEDEK